MRAARRYLIDILTKREEMQSLFDPHIDGMLRKIREQLDFARVKAFGNPQVVSCIPERQLKPHGRSLTSSNSNI